MLTTTHICLSNYLGLPNDVSNIVVSYLESDSKWIPQFDNDGHIYRKVNAAFFSRLSELCYIKSDMQIEQEPHSVIMNRYLVYDRANSYVLRTFINDQSDIQVILYTSIEVARDVFEYMTISYIVNSTSLPVREFCRGILHRPYEQLEWNRTRTITDFHMVYNHMYIEHDEQPVQEDV